MEVHSPTVASDPYNLQRASTYPDVSANTTSTNSFHTASKTVKAIGLSIGGFFGALAFLALYEFLGLGRRRR
ncbi:uncharacterized protein L3040_006463 [Drepanopeziza brunnea f. sp. 'multigermtubi']|uniref:Uncharacterized protein n=1 Tax=Marssonina brunnea f. sp. multigermtubi (strain MB_m1) TaxID=1072389 RepID=K1WSX5_MARBU|nr:uncharacterized protein MBM_01427 [Drepanopeziza brunnea f. sp. 'multigermtubi' MB_m1]EKD20745.1 hypothetical protein MBM_01427 [Drepanopeziza brunnea f. sp. 'multigermtubi' MB_m1]KAJ5038784.1 hypothetical protein L3040_006463 [Drepanopeziza brunnea f. sp. 'multigermtubi']